MRLKDKVALITGGARGIGLGFAEAFAREGAQVVIADIDIDRAMKSVAAIGPAAKAMKLDVTDLSAIDTLVAAVDQEFGGIDILINNAAIFDMAPVNEITEESYDRIFSINLKGPLFMMKAVSKVMIKRSRGGKIINMASQAGRRGEALVLLYCASKAAIISA
ncbi:SDR family NAD(P)-dependent oxidoreductase, partial [Rhizobium sp. Pop5]